MKPGTLSDDQTVELIQIAGGGMTDGSKYQSGRAVDSQETSPSRSSDSERMAAFGYDQELRRVLNFFGNFGIAFTYISPVVGVYSLFVLGLGSGGPRYLWLMLVVLIGQMLVALTFAEFGSSFPLAGALYQWAKNLAGPGYGWFVGWIYGWALIITVAAVDTGSSVYVTELINKYLGTELDPVSPNTVLAITLGMIAVQTAFNIVGVQFSALITKAGVIAEVAATLGIALILGISGFHHGLGYLFSTEGVERAGANPLGVGFGGNWLLGAALVAVLAHVYIFYGFESAGDVAEEVIDASNQVPRAIISSLAVAGVTSFIFVASMILAIPATQNGFSTAASFEGGIAFILGANIGVALIRDIILVLVIFAFFSCGTAIQAAAARLIYSYSRDGGLPGGTFLSAVSRKFQTPTRALIVAAIIPALFSLLVRFTPSQPIKIGFITYPAELNALFVLVSFGVSGIYLAFQMVVIAGFAARLRGWRPDGRFTLGPWAIPVYLGATVYGVAMLLNIVIPTGVNSPKGLLFNYDWLTMMVVVAIVLLGAIYFVTARPASRIAQRGTAGPAGK